MVVEVKPKNEIRILGAEGDTVVAWDHDDEAEVQTARDTFDRMTRQGYLAYRAEGKDDRRGSQIRTFDPTIERIVLVPAMRGG